MPNLDSRRVSGSLATPKRVDMTLSLRINPELTIQPGDFHARLDEDALVIPRIVADVLRRVSVGSAEEFVVYLNTYPTYFEKALGWKSEQVKSARDGLMNVLRGAISDELLSSEPEIIRHYGALHPDHKR